MKDAAVLRAAHLVGALSRLSGKGGGTALPGLLVERAAPELIPTLASRLSQGTILVTGTNGKTTTARFLAGILRGVGYNVLHNRAGSNLIRGVASALVQETGPASRTAPIPAFGLFEIDEATLPEAIRLLQPRLVLLLNLFRDQLDRYGEVDTVARLWAEGLAQLPSTAEVALNADDPLVASLGRDLGERAHYFGLEDPSCGLPAREHAADFVECMECAVPYIYSVTYYGHLGHYRCPSCAWERPAPVVQAEAVQTRGLEGSAATLRSKSYSASIELPLPGLYNVYNLLAAASAATSLGLPLSAVATGVAHFQPAFGRAEQLTVAGKPVVLLLTKNPVGANQVLRTLREAGGPLSFLIALNDYTADGKDISWVWDVDFEALSGQVRHVTTTGHRAADMALRLKYAGWFAAPPEGAPGLHPTVLPGLEQAVRTAVYHLWPGDTLYILATYTALLELRMVLARMGVLRPFWEDQP